MKVIDAMRLIRGALFAGILVFASATVCHAQFIRQYRDIYFLTGIPMDSRTNWNNTDIKFQISVRSCDLRGGSHDGTEWYFGYTQSTVWNIFSESSPFKDNTYNPGLYWSRDRQNGKLTFGIEHMSNGRPYFGNTLAHEGYDDLSRALNYLVMERVWSSDAGQWALRLKAGASCGVGDYERLQNFLTQDMFVNYLGYATVLYDNQWGDWSLHAELTPIVNKSLANADAALSYRFSPSWPALTFALHHGYECLCDCRLDNPPTNYARIGLTFEIFR